MNQLINNQNEEDLQQAILNSLTTTNTQNED